MPTTDRSDSSDSPMTSPPNTRNDAALVENIETIHDNESWNDLSSPEPESAMMLTELNNRLRTQTHDTAIHEEFRDPVSNSNPDVVQQGSPFVEEVPEWQKTAKRTLVFIGYTITTVLFSVIIYLHSLLVRCSYDEETSTTLLDGVFRAQENAIDDYHRRQRIQVEVDDN
ncbi:hypothetical protein CORT_0B07690 [Candida orthopsilosis Co 90-125]|uniref:Uncharacterized protein n=1 Tax=Candida orthopsilosis (strain 90-125) TaxID=1136231 RepID=H8X1S0_CANO9|nr:hypothetical protein CORT_0B07690 [Candida orthopsilosis Co 90-125]CCG22475.1 hypothetical protein CORT_0B07690 [Candida orthopsilosis Co 90-125]